MTVARALVELKTLDKRITKGVSELELVKVRRKDDKWDVQDFSRKAQIQLQSTLDLIDRRDLLKRKVIQSNATTKVTIAGKSKIVGPGSVAFVMPGDKHVVDNAGNSDATFFILKYKIKNTGLTQKNRFRLRFR